MGVPQSVIIIVLFLPDFVVLVLLALVLLEQIVVEREAERAQVVRQVLLAAGGAGGKSRRAFDVFVVLPDALLAACYTVLGHGEEDAVLPKALESGDGISGGALGAGGNSGNASGIRRLGLGRCRGNTLEAKAQAVEAVVLAARRHGLHGGPQALAGSMESREGAAGGHAGAEALLAQSVALGHSRGARELIHGECLRRVEAEFVCNLKVFSLPYFPLYSI